MLALLLVLLALMLLSPFEMNPNWEMAPDVERGGNQLEGIFKAGVKRHGPLNSTGGTPPLNHPFGDGLKAILVRFLVRAPLWLIWEGFLGL